MPEPNGPARWVIVVDATQETLYQLLVERLGDAATVLLDRRTVERRRGSQGSPAERRRVSRRAQRALARVYVEGVAGHLVTAFVEPTGGRVVPVDPTHLCPTCEAHIAFELPRFPHKPARIDTQIIHVQPPGAPPEHYVEIQAFTPTGRALLNERVRVHRRR